MGDWLRRACGWSSQAMIEFGAPGAALIATFFTSDPLMWAAVWIGGYLIAGVALAIMAATLLPQLVREWLDARRRQRLDWI